MRCLKELSVFMNHGSGRNLGARLGSVCLSLILLLTMAGCGQEEIPEGIPYSVYVLNYEETKITPRTIYIETEDPTEAFDALIREMSITPAKLEYKSPLAMGFQILSTNLTPDGRLTIDLSEEYKNLNGVTEILARAAIVRTLTQLSNVRYISMTVAGNQLYDRVGDSVGWMGEKTFIDNDGNDINTYEPAKIKLYFTNATGDKLIMATREKRYSTTSSLERFVVEELISGPTGQIEGLYPTINPDTRVISVITKDGVCYVNLDSSFLTIVNNVPTEIAIYSIVDSLVELGNVHKVSILINGETPSSFSSAVYERNLDYVTTLDSGESTAEQEKVEDKK